jgi:hypothetical protein
MTVPRLDDSPIPTVTDDQRRQAALVVCSRAGDHETARLLLDALGLLDDPVVGQHAAAG